MRTPTTWFVVADGAHARILARKGRTQRLTNVFPYEFAAPHAPNRRFVTDRPGAFADRGPGAHAYAPRIAARDLEKLAFIRDVAAVVDEAAEAQAFDRLILIAPPATLGGLRTMLNEKTKARIAAEIKKDLTHLSLPALERHLAEIAVA